MLRSVFSVIGAFIVFQAQTQPASFQDCLGAIPVCQQIYEENRAPVGNGNIVDFAAQGNCTVGESHSIWYTFTVNNSGQFGFVLTPNDPNQDYDWILFDITNASCEDIYDDPSLVVSCNAAGGSGCHGATGATGDTEFDEQGPNCNNLPPDQNNGYSPFNDLVDVEAGNTYALCIINFSNVSSRGYTLDFGLSADIGIYDDTPPVFEEASYPDSCNGQEIAVRFSEFIQCATIDAANFQLNGPAGAYSVDLSSVNCDAGGNYSKEFLLAVDPPIQPGEAVDLALTVDGSTEALDLCDNPAAPASMSLGGPAFNGQLDLGPDTSLCGGASIILENTLPGTPQWSDGSSGPTLEVSAPGIYWVNVDTPCGVRSDTIEVSASDELPVADLGNDTLLCPSQTLLLDATFPGATYLWQDGSTAPTFSVSQAGPYSVTVTNACGQAQSEVNVDIAGPIDVELNDANLCPGESVSFDASSPGAAYLWQDGSTEAVYTANTPGIYSVTISNACETVELSAEVLGTSDPIPDITLGTDTVLCPGESLLLELDIPGVSYLWQDGTETNSFTVTSPGTYSVTVSNECESRTASIQVGVQEPITASLPPDTVLCPGQRLLLDVTDKNADFYSWQDNAAEPVYIVSGPGLYSVLVANQCEEVALSINVEGCEICKVYVPNAFSPNSDGRNDVFQPYANCPVEDFNMKIFNRWGALVFETSSINDGWDGAFKGQLVGNDLYIYSLQLIVTENGKPKEISLSGGITVTK